MKRVTKRQVKEMMSSGPNNTTRENENDDEDDDNYKKGSGKTIGGELTNDILRC